MKPWADYHEDLIKFLKDPEAAVDYLNAALEDWDREVFLLALRNVLDAKGGMKKIVKITKINRVNLYKMLNRGSNPGFENIFKLLQAIDISLYFKTKKSRHPRKAA